MCVETETKQVFQIPSKNAFSLSQYSFTLLLYESHHIECINLSKCNKTFVTIKPILEL